VPCYHPVDVPWKGYVDHRVTVPCGQCIGCRLERSRQWAVRCFHEAQMHEQNCFATFTYRSGEVPAGGSLVKKDFQDFVKRLRKRCGYHRGPKGSLVSDVSYFHCGEYGERLSRPHYHACLFGVDFPDKVPLGRSESGEPYFSSAALDALWQKGFCSCGSVTFESAAYVARYVLKKVSGSAAGPHYERVDPSTGEIFSVLPEYTTMSLKPGIGARWFEKYRSDVFPSDEVVVRGRKMRPPRYYDKLLGVGDAPGLERLKRCRVEAQGEHREDHTPRRLLDAEVVKEAQVRFLKRSLGD